MESEGKRRRKVISRANRMLRQSRTLRKLSDELLKESKDLREAEDRTRKKSPQRNRR